MSSTPLTCLAPNFRCVAFLFYADPPMALALSAAARRGLPTSKRLTLCVSLLLVSCINPTVVPLVNPYSPTWVLMKFAEEWAWPKHQSVRFWWHSGARSGSRAPGFGSGLGFTNFLKDIYGNFWRDVVWPKNNHLDIGSHLDRGIFKKIVYLLLRFLYIIARIKHDTPQQRYALY